jgi:hypothetical protein
MRRIVLSGGVGIVLGVGLVLCGEVALGFVKASIPFGRHPVEPGCWELTHDFGEGPTLPAGTQVTWDGELAWVHERSRVGFRKCEDPRVEAVVPAVGRTRPRSN